MAFRCVNCGGDVLFDVETQAMKCLHCGSAFSPEQYRVKNQSAGESVPEEGLTLFTCGGCGAELRGTVDSRVGFCPYCGGQSLLASPSGGGSDTESILPFQISRERCAELFRAHTKGVRYLPRELKDAAHLESFTGIYMPYYEYDVELGASHIKGTKVVESNARYEVVNTYEIDASVDGDYCGVPYDASRYFDDEIAARVLPFDMGKERPFSAAYLSGFYADASTVPPETYESDAAEQASKDVVEEVGERVLSQDGIKVDAAESRVEARTRGHHSALLPLWFLTWRKDERVAYAVVNGESGKVVTDLPVDMKAFALGCAVIAAAVFAVLELFFQPTPLLTSVVSLIAGALMAASIQSSTKRIFEKQTHLNDKGWSGGADPAAVETGTEKKKKTRQFPAWILVLIGFYAAYYAVTQASDAIPKIAAAAVAVCLLFVVKKVAGWQSSIPDRQPMLAVVLTYIAVVVNAAIIIWSPVNDLWYYAGDAVCILILAAAAVVMTQVYNIGTTRPLPRLFDREEVR